MWKSGMRATAPLLPGEAAMPVAGLEIPAGECGCPNDWLLLDGLGCHVLPAGQTGNSQWSFRLYNFSVSAGHLCRWKPQSQNLCMNTKCFLLIINGDWIFQQCHFCANQDGTVFCFVSGAWLRIWTCHWHQDHLQFLSSCMSHLSQSAVRAVRSPERIPMHRCKHVTATSHPLARSKHLCIKCIQWSTVFLLFLPCAIDGESQWFFKKITNAGSHVIYETCSGL